MNLSLWTVQHYENSRLCRIVFGGPSGGNCQNFLETDKVAVGCLIEIVNEHNRQVFKTEPPVKGLLWKIVDEQFKDLQMKIPTNQPLEDPDL